MKNGAKKMQLNEDKNSEWSWTESMCEKIDIYLRSINDYVVFKLKWISTLEWTLPPGETLQQRFPPYKNGCDWNNDCIVTVWNSFAAAEGSEADTKKITL